MIKWQTVMNYDSYNIYEKGGKKGEEVYKKKHRYGDCGVCGFGYMLYRSAGWGVSGIY